MQGIGVLSRVGVATEATPGTPMSSVAVFFPILSEGVNANRTNVPSGSIVGDSMTQGVAPGIINCEGPISMEFDGNVIGQAIWLWNGNAGYTVTTISASLGAVTAAPGLAAATSGGSLITAVPLYYQISTALTRTIDGVVVIMPGSAEATITPASPDLKVTLTWTNPGSLPTGYTLYGTIIWRGLTTGTESLLTMVTGSTATYVDTGAGYTGCLPNTNITPYSSALYQHVMIGGPPVSAGDRLTAFTYFSCKDNDIAERYAFCMMDTWKLALPGLGEKVAGEFTCKGATADTLANFTPTYVVAQPFVGWQATMSASGVQDVTIENFEINCTNSVTPVPGMRGKPFNRAVISGAREVKATFNRQFTDHTYWNMMLAGFPFSLSVTCFGGSVADPIAHGLSPANSGTVAMFPWQLSVQVDLWHLMIDKAGAPIAGKEREIEQITITAFKDQGKGTEMTVTLINSTPAYA